MRQFASLFLTILCCVGLAAADFSPADLTAIADKAKTMKEGETSSLKMTINGKVVFVGMVMGKNGLTIGGEGVGGTYKFLYAEQGLVVQATQGGTTSTVLVKDGKASPAPAGLAAAFGAGAVSVGVAAQPQPGAQPGAPSGAPSGAQPSGDANSLSSALTTAFSSATWSTQTGLTIPTTASASVIQGNAIITANASDAQTP